MRSRNQPYAFVFFFFFRGKQKPKNRTAMLIGESCMHKQKNCQVGHVRPAGAGFRVVFSSFFFPRAITDPSYGHCGDDQITDDDDDGWYFHFEKRDLVGSAATISKVWRKKKEKAYNSCFILLFLQ